MKMKVLIYMIIIVNLMNLRIVNSQSWVAVSDTNIRYYIHKIFFPTDDSNKIVIASDNIPMDLDKQDIEFWDHYPQINGLGFAVSTDKGSTFTGNYLNGFFVYEIVQDPNNQDKWFASVRNDGENAITLSTDAGNSWDTDNLYSKGKGGKITILSIVAKKSNPTRYLTASVNTSEGFATTTDDFKTFEKNSELLISSRDIEVSPLDTNLIFLAGDEKHQGGVFKSRDNGRTWEKNVTGIENLRIHTVMPSAYDPSIVVCGADTIPQSGKPIGKGIFISLDTGNTWQLASAKGAIVYHIARHPLNPRYMAAACGTDGIWVSGSWGTSWEQITDGLPDTASFRSVGIPAWSTTDEGIVIYAGSNGSGLWKSNRIKTTVEEQSDNFSKLSLIKAFPSPFNDLVKITWFNPKPQNLKISVKDINGNNIENLVDSNFNEGINSINWSPDYRIAKGTYFIVITNGLQTSSEKVIYLK